MNMKTFNQWMDEYGVDHQNPTNQNVHKICVPLIMFSILGILWSLPRPILFDLEINWAFVLIVTAMLFYVSLKNFKMLVLMVMQTFLMCMACKWFYERNILLQTSLIVFVLSWIGQFIGHKIEGRKPSFLQDISFCLLVLYG